MQRLRFPGVLIEAIDARSIGTVPVAGRAWWPRWCGILVERQERRAQGPRSAGMEPSAFSPAHFTWMDALLRIGAALVLSLALGLERFLRKKPIDFRPFVIIALASCALTVSILEFAYRVDDDTLSVDPGRVVSGVMTGIGFIGAGALFREEHTVYGAGSAASIWAAGAIGLVCGLGLVWLAALLTGTLLALLILSRPFTREYTIQIDDEDEGEERRKGQ